MKKTISATAAAAAAFLAAGSARAAEISTNTAIMQAMDKITGQVDLIEIPVNQEVVFGSLSIVVRECKTRTPEETPENFAFVDVVDKNTAAGDVNIFKGWMLSSSPALNPVAHPVYDVWLLKCANKLVDPQNLMSKEQLEARDAVVMNRDATEKALENQPQTDTPEETPFSQNADGVPINLIPDDVADETVEDNAETNAAPAEQQPSAPVSETEKAPAAQPAAAETDTAAQTEEGAPQALIDFSAQETVETAPEAAAQEADFETIDIASPAETAPAEQPAEKAPSAEESAAASEIPQPETAISENNGSNPEETSAETAASVEKAQNAENSEDIINKLEQELSAQLIGE